MSLERNSTSLSRALELSWPPDSGKCEEVMPAIEGVEEFSEGTDKSKKSKIPKKPKKKKKSKIPKMKKKTE